VHLGGLTLKTDNVTRQNGHEMSGIHTTESISRHVSITVWSALFNSRQQAYLVTVSPGEVLRPDVLVGVLDALLEGREVLPVLPMLGPEVVGVDAGDQEGGDADAVGEDVSICPSSVAWPLSIAFRPLTESLHNRSLSVRQQSRRQQFVVQTVSVLAVMISIPRRPGCSVELAQHHHHSDKPRQIHQQHPVPLPLSMSQCRQLPLDVLACTGQCIDIRKGDVILEGDLAPQVYTSRQQANP
jgi:hypothetical protein